MASIKERMSTLLEKYEESTQGKPGAEVPAALQEGSQSNSYQLKRFERAVSDGSTKEVVAGLYHLLGSLKKDLEDTNLDELARALETAQRTVNKAKV